MASHRHGTTAARQRGAALVISAIVITTIMAFAVLTAGRASRNELAGAYYGSVALQALLSAETGLQRGTKRYSQGLTACASISETLTNYPTGYNIIILGKSTDFSNVAIGVTGSPTGAITSCRIEATAVHAATGVARKVSHIIDTSLFDQPTENMNLNTGTLTGWTTSTTSGYAGATSRSAGGPDGAHPACSLSAYLGRTTATAQNITGTNRIYFNHDTAAAGTFTFTFSRRYLGADANNANRVRFGLTDSAGTPFTSFTGYRALNPGAGAYSGANPPSIAPAPFACNDLYTVGDTLTVSITAARVNPIQDARYNMELRATGTNKEIFLDNISISPPAITTGGTYTRIRQWRECVPWDPSTPANNNCP